MMGHWTRALRAGGLAIALLTTSTVAATAAPNDNHPVDVQAGRDKTATPDAPATTNRQAPRTTTGPEAKGVHDGTQVGSEGIKEAVDAYQRAYPGIDLGAAEAAARGQQTRKDLYDAVLAKRQANFGGAWFDPPTNVLHVAVTSDALGGDVDAWATEVGQKVRVHRVERSFDDLDAAATRLRSDRTALGTAAAGRVGIDVRTNEVVAQVSRSKVRALAAVGAETGVRVEAATTDVELDACNDRADCNDSVRAGSVMWRGSVGTPWCSTGVTGRSTATNFRYVFTAGHCSNGNGVTWGTGSWTIGTMAFSANAGDLDVGAVRATWWPYTWQPGGDIWMQNAVDRRVDMDAVAPTQSWIWVGDTVCLAANYTDTDAAGNRCGVVGSNADPAAGGKTRVDGVDACGGDSGGGWYWLVGGTRWGYGVHSSSNIGCNGSNGGNSSWFTTLPRLKTWFPAIVFEIQ